MAASRLRLAHRNRDETRFFDPRNRAETELSYVCRRLAPASWGQISFLLDFEPRLCPCRGFPWKTVTKLDDILIFCCVSGFFAGVVVAVATLPG
jgi:hypothetical protein